jgi:ribonuclease Z
MRIRFLGTGGAANEARHQAAVLVEWGEPPDVGRILLDTGSGFEVVRRLLAVGCPPTAIRDIFVSHQHFDHVGGLEPLLLWSAIRALEAHDQAPREETRVHADPRVLADIEQLFGAVVTAAPRLFAGTLRWIPSADGGTIALPCGGRLTTVRVDHLPPAGGALGCAVEAAGARVVYSGDTRPSPRLAELARGADLLLHEAGGLDGQAETVHRLGHSTAGDAGRLARAAGVGRLVLLHVPTEEATAQMVGEARAAFGGPVALAHDLDVIEV